MSDSESVPLMFQAQVAGRSQIQKLDDLKKKAEKLGVKKESLTQQAYDWALQWRQACDKQNTPKFEAHIQTRDCQFAWRMVTNSGQDAGLIRPVIGERGWAFFPGSSMKGAFLRACKKLCSSDDVLLFCGGKDQDDELRPGRLRFHGGYPTNAKWLDDSLVDVVHPQEDWQTKNQSNHSALIQISLYKPNFTFGISSSKPLSKSQWDTVWLVWQTALEQGLGSRVSAGYGQIATHGNSRLVSFGLFGQGAASKLINGESEFRPNIFKAALRGHTRRLFNGITDEYNADKITKILWGGIDKGKDATLGLLGIAFNADDLKSSDWISAENSNNVVPVYKTSNASLDILLMQSNLTNEQKDELKKFIIRLMRFGMLIGGFGKSWRRSDHRIFYQDYQKQMIGCYWGFTKRYHPFYIPFNDDLSGITEFLNDFLSRGRNLSWLKNLTDRGNPTLNIREAWHKDNVQVWGRLAQDEEDSQAIMWLHKSYKTGYSIKQTHLTGWSSIRDREPKTMIGRLWHRMYPQFNKEINKDGKPIWKSTGKYAELLTIFPNITDNEKEQKIINDFLNYLKQNTDFKHLW